MLVRVQFIPPHAGVAQREVRLICNQQGAGSTPATGSTAFTEESMEINSKGFICCPKCGGKTKTKVIPKETELKSFPLWCPWCKTEQKIDYK